VIIASIKGGFVLIAALSGRSLTKGKHIFLAADVIFSQSFGIKVFC
jgi:hypothetical protein